MSMRNKKMQQTQDVNLSQQELMEASKALIIWLGAWRDKAWDVMSALTQCPLVGQAKTDYVKSQFFTQLLVDWDEDILATKAMADTVKDKHKETRIGYVDFAVVLLVSNGKAIGRFGMFVRLVLNGTKWLINPHSINRRFDPKLADMALKELNEEEASDGVGSEDQDHTH